MISIAPAVFAFSLLVQLASARQHLTIHANDDLKSPKSRGLTASDFLAADHMEKESLAVMKEKQDLHHRSLPIDVEMSFQSQRLIDAVKAVHSGLQTRALRSRTAPSAESSPAPSDDEVHDVDFMVAGFTMSGTSALLDAFEKHPETAMASSEQCGVASATKSDAEALRELDAVLQSLPVDHESMKRSFACPTAVYTHKTISHLQAHSPDAKVIIGVRHPVMMLESMYNYRVKEIYENNLEEAIPTLEQVLAQDEPWKDVSLDATRYELFLMQFAKTAFDPSEMKDLMVEAHSKYDLAIEPNQFDIFVYDMEQVQDRNKARSAAFRQELASFLDLSAPLDPFQTSSLDDNSQRYAETISICETRYDSVRRQLMEQGIRTAQWLEEAFLESDDVTVANKSHFLKSLQSWAHDPCLAIAEDGEVEEQ